MTDPDNDRPGLSPGLWWVMAGYLVGVAAALALLASVGNGR